jgi:hypothetical protein
VTSNDACALSYQIAFEEGSARVTMRHEEKSRESKVSGRVVGEATIFLGAELFSAPRACEAAQIEVSVSYEPRFQLSSSLALDELWYAASSVTEAQDRYVDVASMVSSMEELFGAPPARQLLVLGAAPAQPKTGKSAILNHKAKGFDATLARAIVSLWLTSGGASDYYQLWLRLSLGMVTPEVFVESLSKSEAAGRFFCLDVLARSKGEYLSSALREKMLAREAMSERAVAESLQISDCSGDGLKIAGPSAGITVSKRGAKLVKPAALLTAIGL